MSVKKYNITVDGVTHVVEVEEVGSVSVSAAPTAAPVIKAAPAPAPKAAPKAAPAPKAAAAAGDVPAPLQGTVLSVEVKVGDTVKAGQTLVVIEAMKMENEIVAPSDGKVTAVKCNKGESVAAGDPLVTLG